MLKINIDIIRGFFLMSISLIICNHSLRCILDINLIWLSFSICIISFIFINIKNYKILNLNYFDIFVLIFFLFIFSYSFFQILFTGISNAINSIEIIILFVFYLFGRIINQKDIEIICYYVIFVGSIHSILLITMRPLVYTREVNYLLMSICIGIACCVSYMLLYNTKLHLIKKCFLFCTMLINAAALVNLQSRVVFFLIFIYIITHLSFKVIKKRNFIILGVASTLLIIFYKPLSEFLISSFKYSVISIRIKDSIVNYSDEPRIYIYSKIFENINEFWLTGYGINQTTFNLFQNMVHNFPHNFLLEFWTEFGILGLSLSLLFCLYPIVRIVIKRINTVNLNVVVFIYLFFFINFMKSFSIYDSNLLFLSTGILVHNLSNRYDFKLIVLK